MSKEFFEQTPITSLDNDHKFGVGKGPSVQLMKNITWASLKTLFNNLIGAFSHDSLANVQDAGDSVLKGHITNLFQLIYGNKLFQNQAHGGSYTIPFSASATVSANNGNNQMMIVTGDTTISLDGSEFPGTFLIHLVISTAIPPTITLDSSLGTPYNNTLDLDNADGVINTLTVIVLPNGTKKYTITN